MDPFVLQFLKQAGVEDHKQGFEDLGVMHLRDLQEIEPEDLDGLGMKKIPRRRFERMLKDLDVAFDDSHDKDLHDKDESWEQWSSPGKRQEEWTSWEQDGSWRRHRGARHERGSRSYDDGWSRDSRRRDRHGSWDERDNWHRDDSRERDSRRRRYYERPPRLSDEPRSEYPRSENPRSERARSVKSEKGGSRSMSNSTPEKVFKASPKSARSRSSGSGSRRSRSRSRGDFFAGVPDHIREALYMSKGTKAGNTFERLSRDMQRAVAQAFRPHGDTKDKNNVSRQLAGLMYYASKKRRVIVVRLHNLPDPWTLPLGGLSEEPVFETLSEFGVVENIVMTNRKVHQLPLDAIDAIVQFARPKGALRALGNIPGIKIGITNAKVKTTYFSSNHESLDLEAGHPGNFMNRARPRKASRSRSKS